MPEYKKKHINRLKNKTASAKNRQRRSAYERQDILMSSSKASAKNQNQKSDMRVVKGKKLEQRRRRKVFSVILAGIAVLALVLHLVLPVGIIENVQNLTALIGSGGYPAELTGNGIVTSSSHGMYYYVLTDTRLNAFAANGKNIYSYAHGFEEPILKTSKTRAMVFAQGGRNAVIYNLSSLKADVETEQDIITADISDSGTYAIVTASDTYAAAVSVYNKNNKLIYEWYSSEDIVNNISVSPNGKKIAVSAFNTSAGTYKSKVCVLNFDSATPEYTEIYDETLVLELNTTHNGIFAAVTSNGTDFISWSDYKKISYKNEYNVSAFRAGSGGFAAVFNRESDRTDNRIAVFSAKGKLKSEFEFKGIISDIQIYGGHIYCISDTHMYLLDSSGKILRKADCGFGAVRLAVTAANTAAVITDNRIERIKFEQEQ